MAELQKTSPKKLPIDEWVNRVKKIDGSSLKDEEKKVFNLVKAHKNIPKTPSKFANFCTHNLKVKDEKIVNRLWGFMSVGLHEQKGSVKETKDAKKLKLEKKLAPKDSKLEKKLSPKESKLEKKLPPNKLKLEKKLALKKTNGHARGDDGEDRGEKDQGTVVKLDKKQKLLMKKAEKTAKFAQAKDVDGNSKPKQQAKKNVSKGAIQQNKAKLEVKKKVSFSKSEVPEVSKSNAKAGAKPKVPLKGTPMKVDAKKSKADLKKKISQDEDDDDDDDDDDESSDEMDFDDDDLSDEDIEDSDEELDDEDSEFDLDDDDDDDDGDEEEDDDDDDDDDDDEEDEDD